LLVASSLKLRAKGQELMAVRVSNRERCPARDDCEGEAAKRCGTL